ncbi:MAG: O-antigen ligase family protein [Paludibacteraceae bacterium]|nr:O-antigen ligase family protein [Paludibacteraceae bacterium]
MLIVWAVTWLLEGRFLKRENLQWSKALYPAIGLALLVLAEIISILWGGHFPDSQVSLLILPFILLFGVNELYDWRTLARIFIGACAGSIFLYGFTLYWTMNQAYILTNEAAGLTPFQLSYFDDYLSYIKHRLYYSTLFSIAIVLTMMLLVERWKQRKRVLEPWRNNLWIATDVLLIILMLATIVVTKSRAGLLTLLLVAAVALMRYVTKRYSRWWNIAIIAVFVASVLGFWKWHPRMQQVHIEDVTNITEHLTGDGVQPRLIIWYCALRDLPDYFWTGNGAGNAKAYLAERYKQVGFEYGLYKHYSAHNQYLLTLLDLGIWGVILLIAAWVALPLVQPKGSKGRVLAFYFAIIWCSNMLTDDLLLRIEGIVYVCVFFVLIRIMSYHKEG